MNDIYQNVFGRMGAEQVERLLPGLRPARVQLPFLDAAKRLPLPDILVANPLAEAAKTMLLGTVPSRQIGDLIPYCDLRNLPNG